MARGDSTGLDHSVCIRSSLCIRVKQRRIRNQILPFALISEYTLFHLGLTFQVVPGYLSYYILQMGSLYQRSEFGLNTIV